MLLRRIESKRHSVMLCVECGTTYVVSTGKEEDTRCSRCQLKARVLARVAKVDTCVVCERKTGIVKTKDAPPVCRTCITNMLAAWQRFGEADVESRAKSASETFRELIESGTTHAVRPSTDADRKAIANAMQALHEKVDRLTALVEELAETNRLLMAELEDR